MESLTKNSWIDWSVATVTLSGQSQSGDLHLVRPFRNGVLMAVVDGLGHGPEAAAAAQSAVDILDSKPDETIVALLRRCHEKLRGTRGAVITLGSLDGANGTMTWGGVGNVEGLILYANNAGKPTKESLLLRAGVVGGRLPALNGSSVSLKKQDTIIFATDGIRSGFGQDVDFSRTPREIAAHILSRHAKGNDDALVLVARYLGEMREAWTPSDAS